MKNKIGTSYYKHTILIIIGIIIFCTTILFIFFFQFAENISQLQDGMQIIEQMSLHNQLTPQQTGALEAYERQVKKVGLIAGLKLALVFLALTSVIIWTARHSRRMLMESFDDLQVNEERLRIATEQMVNMVFDYDRYTKGIYYSTEQMLKYGLDCPYLSNIPHSLIEKGIIMPESAQECIAAFEAIDQGADRASCNVKTRLNDHSVIWEKVTLINIFDEEDKVTRTVGTIEDITERQKRELSLKYMAERDHLTGLYNRAGLESHMNRLLDLSGKHAFLLIDMDNFKMINDTWGHQTGDKVLKDIASILLQSVRDHDIVARLGGDEFVVILKNLEGPKEVLRRADQISYSLTKTYEQLAQSITVSATIGIALIPDHHTSYKELYAFADTALYQAKLNHKGKCAIYE